MNEPVEQAQPAPGDDLPEQMQVRLDKRDKMIARGLDPYPISVPRSHELSELVATYDAEQLGPTTTPEITSLLPAGSSSSATPASLPSPGSAAATAPSFQAMSSSPTSATSPSRHAARRR